MMLSRFSLPSALAGACLLAACAAMPDLGTLPEGAESSPGLLPMDQLLSALPAGDTQAAGTAARLSERAAGLQNRARMMQGAMDDPATRERLRRSGPA